MEEVTDMLGQDAITLNKFEKIVFFYPIFKIFVMPKRYQRVAVP